MRAKIIFLFAVLSAKGARALARFTFLQPTAQKISNAPGISTSKRRERRAPVALGFCSVLAALLAVRALAGELPSVPDDTVLKGFVDPIHYDPPNQNQLKQVRRAAEARPQGNTNILLIDMTVETYATNGALDLTAHAPICNWNVRSNIASSPSRVSIRSVPGKMFHEADGFLWDNNNQMIYFSNNVHTIIQNEPLAAKKP